MTAQKIAVYVSGLPGAGKGTLGLALARHFDLQHLDVGLFYRLCAQFSQNDISIRCKPGISQPGRDLVISGGAKSNILKVAWAKAMDPGVFEQFKDPALRSQEHAERASALALMPEFHEVAINFQKKFLRGHLTTPNDYLGVVVDGQDCGTHVRPDLPNPTASFFLVATLEARAARRVEFLKKHGFRTTLKQARDDLAARELRDLSRPHYPLLVDPDAVRIDTTDLSSTQVLDLAVAHIHQVVRDWRSLPESHM